LTIIQLFKDDISQLLLRSFTLHQAHKLSNQEEDIVSSSSIKPVILHGTHDKRNFTTMKKKTRI